MANSARDAGHFMHTYTPTAEDSANWSIGEGLETIDLQSGGTTPTPSQIARGMCRSRSLGRIKSVGGVKY